MGSNPAGSILTMDQKRAIMQLKALEKLIPDKEMRLAAEWDERWKVLISTILSAQTKDETTIKISNILYKKYPAPAKLASAPLSEIRKIIRPINYHKTKARQIKETARIISEKGIPQRMDGLLELPGVGRKVANVYLAEAHGAPCIGVDAHVTRISQKLGWSKHKNPHRIEKDLERLFPKRCWNSINYIVVRFGRSTKRSQEDKILKEAGIIR